MNDGKAKAERRGNLSKRLSVVASLVLLSSANLARAQTTPQAISARFADVDGIKLHYLAAGHGPTVILLHGYVETYHSAPGPDVYSDCARPAGHRRLGDPKGRSGHEDRRHPHPRTRQVAGCREGESGGARHRVDGRVRVRRAISNRNGEACSDGRVPTRRRGMGVSLQQSKYLAFPLPRPDA